MALTAFSKSSGGNFSFCNVNLYRCYYWFIKKGKTLKFDLAIVVLLQVMVFTFGFYTIAQGRPLWIVASNYNFQLVKNNEINDQSIQYAAEAFKSEAG